MAEKRMLALSPACCAESAESRVAGPLMFRDLLSRLMLQTRKPTPEHMFIIMIIIMIIRMIIIMIIIMNICSGVGFLV